MCLFVFHVGHVIYTQVNVMKSHMRISHIVVLFHVGGGGGGVNFW